LNWSPAESDGGSAITGYNVEKLSGTRWIKVTKKAITKCTYAVSDVIEGLSDNEYRVNAENLAGVGPPSETTGRFTVKNEFDVPGKPDAPLVSDLKVDLAKVSWAPPTSDCGSLITSYILEMKANGETKWKVVKKYIKKNTHD